MNKTLLVIVAAGVIAAGTVSIIMTPSSTTIPIPEPKSNIHSVDNNPRRAVSTIAQNLEAPRAVDIAHDGRIFFIEKIGRLRVILPNGTFVHEPVITIPVAHSQDNGLLGLALHPRFDENHLIYLFYTYESSGKLYNKVLAITEKRNKIISEKVIIENIPGALFNNGGRLKFGPDGKLYISTGDAATPNLSQDIKSLAGKILRVDSDGSIPTDNPFSDSAVYSFGHRNVQGLAWQPTTKQLYATEESGFGTDEINLIRAGRNYGWPSQECNAIDRKFENPLFCFNPSIGATGATFNITNADKGDLIIGTLKGYLRVIHLESKIQSNILVGYGSLRDVTYAQDGSLYVVTSNNEEGSAVVKRNDDRILRIMKA
jgi:aldose sugar dehydrogenase